MEEYVNFRLLKDELLRNPSDDSETPLTNSHLMSLLASLSRSYGSGLGANVSQHFSLFPI